MVALTDLRTRDRRLFMAMAAEAETDADDILAETLASYATLVRDAPAALPRDRLAALALKAWRAGHG